jgi:asparagine synthase (glutamine-hydrolysing)
MCGVCGIVSFSGQPDLALLRQMIGRWGTVAGTASGYYWDRHAALGHTRLGIIDTSGGAQPLCNEDGTM